MLVGNFSPVLDKVVLAAIVGAIACGQHGMTKTGTGALCGAIHSSRVVLGGKKCYTKVAYTILCRC